MTDFDNIQHMCELLSYVGLHGFAISYNGGYAYITVESLPHRYKTADDDGKAQIRRKLESLVERYEPALELPA